MFHRDMGQQEVICPISLSLPEVDDIHWFKKKFPVVFVSRLFQNMFLRKMEFWEYNLHLTTVGAGISVKPGIEEDDIFL